VQASRLSSPPSFASVLRAGGAARLWRGASAVLVSCVPSHAAYFSAYEAVKRALGADAPGHHPLAAGAAGVAATALHDAVATPLDVVKQRLQLGYYRGVVHCLRAVVREEGPAALFRSYPTTLLMNMPFAAVAVAANESLKKLLAPAGGEPPGLATFLLAGGGAGALASAATCPLDVVKTRLQTDGVVVPGGGGGGGGGTAADAKPPPLRSGGPPAAAGGGGAFAPPPLRAQVAFLYTAPGGRLGSAAAAAAAAAARPGAAAVVRALWAEGGAGAFFKGLAARVAVHAPSGAISWATYELVKAVLVGRPAAHAADER